MDNSNRYCEMFKTLIWFFIISLSLTNCKEIEIIMPSPSITLYTVRQATLTAVEVELSVQKGEGQELKKLEVILEDLTVSSAPKITLVIPSGEISGEKQTVKIETGRLNHDYRVQEILVTDRYSYTTEPLIFRSIKNNFIFYIPDHSLFARIDENIAVHVNPGSVIILAVEFNNVIDARIEIKLNRTISLNHTLDLRKNASINVWSTAAEIFLPEDIPPGDYELYVYVDGWEFRLDKKIRVLEGSWEEIYSRFPGQSFINLSWFTIGDNLYATGHIPYSLYSQVWSLNLSTGEWKRHADFPGIDENFYYNTLMPHPIESGGKGYVLFMTTENSVELWGYDHLNDTWAKETTYPGQGKTAFTCISMSGKLFMGGGIPPTHTDVDFNDWWEYDFSTKNWKRLKNMPLMHTYWQYPNRSCALDGKGYVLELPDKLWEYNPESDIWSFKSKMKIPKRFSTNLIAFNGDLYAVGGAAVLSGPGGNVGFGLKETWRYSIRENRWQLMSFLPKSTDTGFITIWNGQLITGLGFDNRPDPVYNRATYRFIP